MRRWLSVAMGVVALACGPGTLGPGDATEEHDAASIPEVGIDATTPEPTWTDPVTGLVWQDPPSERAITGWNAAKAYCSQNEPGLPGDGWHLPTIGDLRSLVRGCPNMETAGSCGVTATCTREALCYAKCLPCPTDGGPDDGCYRDPALSGDCHCLWSSSFDPDYAGTATVLCFPSAGLSTFWTDFHARVRCVRPRS